MSNSSLISHTRISPNRTSPRNRPVSKITIHHMAGNLSVERCGELFANPERQASSNYGIGSDGRIGLYVDEADRSWCSSSPENDHMAVTIEVANSGGAPDWLISDAAMESLIALCVDICKRNGISRLNYTGDTGGNLTMHKWFAATACPGPYLSARFPEIAEAVNRQLEADTPASPKEPEAPRTLYRVQVGAFANKDNAQKMLQKLEAAGFHGFIAVQEVPQKPSEPVEPEAPAIAVGSTVRLRRGAADYTGKALAAFVYDRDHVVSSVSGDRVVITYGGTTVAAVHLADLTLVR